MKTCCRCNKTKTFEEFNKYKRSKDGHKACCRECQRLEYYQNQERNITQKRLYYQNNKEIISLKTKEYSKKNAEHINQKHKEYYQKNKETLKPKYQAYRQRSEVKQRRNERERLAKAQNPFVKIIANLRTRISEILSGKKYKKAGHFWETVDCKIDFLKQHIESQFLPGMTWENYGRNGWHIDHVIPCEAFRPFTEENQRKCFHYSNLKPIWESDNCSKAAIFELNGQLIDAKLTENIDPIALENLWLENKNRVESKYAQIAVPFPQIPV